MNHELQGALEDLWQRAYDKGLRDGKEQAQHEFGREAMAEITRRLQVENFVRQHTATSTPGAPTDAR